MQLKFSFQKFFSKTIDTC